MGRSEPVHGQHDSPKAPKHQPAQPTKPTRLSICIATYNGARFLDEQMRSILDELGPNDEVIVVDDASSDNTVEILQSYADAGVKTFANLLNMGHVKSFERALSYASGSYVLLADQDDVWSPGRVELFLEALARRPFVASNLSTFGDSCVTSSRHQALTPTNDDRPLSNVVGILLGRRPYYGCAMGMSREFLAHAIPVPRFTTAHDLWFATYANVIGQIGHIEADTVARRVHDNNLSSASRRSLPRQLRARATISGYIAVAFWRRIHLTIGRKRGVSR